MDSYIRTDNVYENMKNMTDKIRYKWLYEIYFYNRLQVNKKIIEEFKLKNNGRIC